eukprot:CAMPEP_0115178384 /NCGR_PEP_ID=MMETSP0270-20121206/5873_1 /TAXON_ID=71861 /ORGANISM="Scrippsiella trochoidea, Strain CCMP3099" /LENGTH=156 /DNA_ID=CAMNT_0002591345 /DNA_START=132 /DNA_END=598 /DNA_ORIENTATION=-
MRVTRLLLQTFLGHRLLRHLQLRFGLNICPIAQQGSQNTRVPTARSQVDRQCDSILAKGHVRTTVLDVGLQVQKFLHHVIGGLVPPMKCSDVCLYWKRKRTRQITSNMKESDASLTSSTRSKTSSSLRFTTLREFTNRRMPLSSEPLLMKDSSASP